MLNPATNEALKNAAIETHSRQADQFAQSYTAPDPYGSCFNYSRHRLDALIANVLPPPEGRMRLLDVGCGTGHHMRRFADAGFVVAGVDGSEEMLHHARANNPGADLRKADVESLPFPDASFDVVMAIEVLRYLPDPTACIREMARVLRPGGICLATASPLFSVNAYPIVNRVASAIPQSKFVRLKQYFSTTRSLRQQFAAAGFGTIDVYGVYFGPINWVERLARSRAPRFMRWWEKFDKKFSAARPLRDLSNMLLVRGVRA